MEVQGETRTVVRSAQFPVKKFGIAMNGMAFKVLSSNLYKNVILAIVRELSTNASDAHVEAGTQAKQFDVHLPNTFEPFFSIRDYGTGLSDQAIEEVYTTYFNSTRTNSNSFTGGFGLGSKTPFAYTDQFTIVSWFNGVQYTYSAFKDESGEPCISPLGMVETTEPNGVSIRVNVAGKDIAAFVESARRVYQFFKVRPNIAGATMVFEDNTPEVEEPGVYHLYDGGDVLPGKVNVVMGQVCYAADGDELSSELGANGHIVLFAPVGACDIQVSREELQYTDKTKAFLAQRVKDALADARKKLEAQVGTTGTTLARMQAVSNFRNLVRFQSNAQQIKLSKDKAWHCVGLEVHSGKLRIFRERMSIEPTFAYNYVFIEDDRTDGEELKQSDKNRLRYYIEENRGSTLFFLAKVEDRAAFDAEFGAIATQLSQLPKVPASKHASFSVDRQYIKRLRAGAWRQADTWQKVADIDPKLGVAIPKRGPKMILAGEELRSIDWILDAAHLLGYEQVYGISAPCYKRLRDEYDLEDFETEAKKFITTYLAKGGAYDLAYLQHEHDNPPSKVMMAALAGLSTQCDDLIALHKAKKPSNGHLFLIRTFKMVIPPVTDYYSAFFSRYPLLSKIQLWEENKELVAWCVQYVKLIEKENS